MNLTEKVFEAIFGNGKEGLLTRTSLLEDAVRNIEKTTTDTNSLIRTIVVPRLETAMNYMGALPTEEREALVARTKAHLDADDNQRVLFGKVRTSTLKVALQAAQAIAVALILARLGLGG